jgi:hypothetical protein
MQNKVVEESYHLLHQFGCSAAAKDPPGIPLQGIIEQIVGKQIRAMHRKVETTHKEVAQLFRRIHNWYNEAKLFPNG